jgi:polyisoprenoid-binding protein YceI
VLRFKTVVKKASLVRAVLGLAMLAAAIAAPQSVSAQTKSYTIDPSHTYPSFEASHLGISWWRGRFNKSSGKVSLDRTARSGTVEVQMDSASLDFGHNKMTETARGKDFFNAEQFPVIFYKGAFSRFEAENPVEVSGELTLLGVTKPVTLKVTSFKCITHNLLKREVCGADVHGSFKRSEFGMTRGIPMPEEAVRLAIQVEAIID